MKADSFAPITLLCCGVFEAEVRALRTKHWPRLAFRVLDSMLHMKPGKLAEVVAAAVEEELRQGHQVVLVYGDCCAQMTALAAHPGVARARGNNCCDMLLGRDVYRRLSREGAFFLLPEWSHRWRHVFETELGLNAENASNLMGDMHRKLIGLDTGVRPVSEKDLHACAQYCGLPCEVRVVSLEPLRAAIQEALDKLTPNPTP